jgi:DTW domain-containing protein YfiP
MVHEEQTVRPEYEAHGRLRCAQCDRPLRTCLCTWVRPTANVASVLILQHPLEVAQAKGSAKLLRMSLQHVQLEVGEVFDPASLQGWLDAPGPLDPTTGQAQALCPVLLYPAEAGSPQPTLHLPPTAIRLVVLDGTWRKSRKMLLCNPLLQKLPRLALRAPPASRYAIRRAHQPDQRSTLEAACLALSQLEGAPARYAPLLDAFDGFVAAQFQAAPK